MAWFKAAASLEALLVTINCVKPRLFWLLSNCACILTVIMLNVAPLQLGLTFVWT